jgi:hypothetical protein
VDQLEITSCTSISFRATCDQLRCQFESEAETNVNCVAGGLWMPEASALAALRQNIDKRPRQIKDVLSLPGIRKEYLGGVAKDEGKVVKRFLDEHKETSLKTKPKVSNISSCYTIHTTRLCLRLSLTTRVGLLPFAVTRRNCAGHRTGNHALQLRLVVASWCLLSRVWRAENLLHGIFRPPNHAVGTSRLPLELGPRHM